MLEIEGIRVLNTYTEPSGIVVLWIFLAIAAFSWVFFETLEGNWGTCSVATVACALMIWMCIWDVTTPKYTYHRVILDGAPYSALVEQYEVTKSEGEILTVRKRADAE